MLVNLFIIVFILLVIHCVWQNNNKIIIRASEEIKGIVINQEETKLLQYADDTTAVLADLVSAQKHL